MNDDRDQAVRRGLARAALYANVFKPIAQWTRSTGLRSNDLRFRSLSDRLEPRVAEDFLVNSRLRRNDREGELSIRDYFTDASAVMLSAVDHQESAGLRRIELPEGTPLRMELGEAVGWRRSVRLYTGDPMRLEHLATVVRCAAGITAEAEADLNQGGRVTLRFRAAASAGGLYPIAVHLAVLDVEGLERGLYRYDPRGDRLLQTGGSAELEVLRSAIDVPDEAISVERANVVLLLVGQPWRAMRKYGPRGMRYVFLEAGAMTQNIHLAAVALGYGGVDCGCVYDDEAHEAMRLDGVYRALLHTVIVGLPG